MKEIALVYSFSMAVSFLLKRVRGLKLIPALSSGKYASVWELVVFCSNICGESGRGLIRVCRLGLGIFVGREILGLEVLLGPGVLLGPVVLLGMEALLGPGVLPGPVVLLRLDILLGLAVLLGPGVLVGPGILLGLRGKLIVLQFS